MVPFNKIREENLLPKILRTCGIVALAALITFSTIFIQGRASRAGALEPDRALTCWRGEVRNILLDYIRSVSTPGSSDFSPSKDRVAVFDMDGTLMSERPFPFVFEATVQYLVRHKNELSSKGPQYRSLCEAAERHHWPSPLFCMVFLTN